MFIRKHVLFSMVLTGVFNFVLMLICNALVNITIPIVMPTLYLTADQFITIWVLLSASGIIFANTLVLKAGIYKTIKNHLEV